MTFTTDQQSRLDAIRANRASPSTTESSSDDRAKRLATIRSRRTGGVATAQGATEQPKTTGLKAMMAGISAGQGDSPDIKEPQGMSTNEKASLLGINLPPAREKTYIDKIGAGEVSPIDPLARAGESAGDVAAKAVVGAVKATPGLEQFGKDLNDYAQGTGDLFNLNKYLPKSVQDGLASGAATGDEVLKALGGFLTGNEFVNVATKDALDASNLAPVAAGAKIAKNVALDPVKGITDAIGKSGVRQVTGLESDTIDTLQSGNKFLADAKKGDLTRETLTETVQDAITKNKEVLSDTGKGYDAIRELDKVIDNPTSEIGELFAKEGLVVGKKGKLVEASKNSSNLTDTDIKQIQQAQDLLAGSEKLNPNQIINLRNKLDDLAKFDKGASTKGQNVIKRIRGIIDQKAGDSIPELKALDESYASQRKTLNAIESDFINKKTGGLKDTAFTKVANSTGKGKEQLLGRLEELEPGITEKVLALRTIEDLKFAANKPGNYVRAGITGAGVVSGNPAVFALAIASQPQVAAILISGWGKAQRGLGALKEATTNSLIKSLESGAKLTPDQISIMGRFINSIATGDILGESLVEGNKQNDND